MKKLMIIITTELNNCDLSCKDNYTNKISDRSSNVKNSLKQSTICTVSGGQDSNCMYLILLHHPESILTIIYCQHFWQMKNFVTSRLLANLSFFFYFLYYSLIPKKKVFTENSARNWRKKNFFRLIELTREKNLLIGQTRTDKTETFFSYLFRGTSAKPFYRNDKKIEKTKILIFPIYIRKQKIKPNVSALKFIKSKELTNNIPKNCSLKAKNLKNTNFFNVSKLGKKRLTKNFILAEKISISCLLYAKTLYYQPRIEYPIAQQNRFVISKCLTHYQFPFISDLTNVSNVFYRNRIRQNLFPLIRYLFQNKIENTISTFLNNLIFEKNIIEKKNKELKILLKNRKSLIKIKKNNTLLFKNDTSLLKEIFYFYQEIELTRLQTLTLKNFL